MTTPARAVAGGRWAAPPPPRAVRLSLGRVLGSAALVAIAIGLVACQGDVRVVEAAGARFPLGLLVGEAVHVPGTDLVFYPDHAGSGLRALKVTFSCSSVPLVAPLALLGAVLVCARRLSPRRVVAGVAAAAAIVFAVNLGRILLIAVVTANFGVDGYEVSHRVIGSAVTVAGACAAFALTFRIVSASAGRRTER